MKHFLLFYDACDGYVEKRQAYRDAHLKYAWAAHKRGELLLAGAVADPVDGAVLLFQGDSARIAEAFAKQDPYVVNGLVTRWRIREWTTVVGESAATPVRPVTV
jgi:uncharacterized protein YciI